MTPPDDATRLAPARARRALASHLRTPTGATLTELTRALDAVPLEARPETLRACVDRLTGSQPSASARAKDEAALAVARQYLSDGAAPPVALVGCVDPARFELYPWRPVFDALDDDAARVALSTLEGILPERHRLQLAPLLARVEAGGPEALVNALEARLLEWGSVHVDLAVRPVGALGAPVMEPLRRRIDALTAAVLSRPSALPSEAYRDRRVVLGLRNALAHAVVATLTGDAVDETWSAYLSLAPTELFEGNADLAFSFIASLPLGELPAPWVAEWVRAWRRSPARRTEQERVVTRQLAAFRGELSPEVFHRLFSTS